MIVLFVLVFFESFDLLILVNLLDVKYVLLGLNCYILNIKEGNYY